MATTSHDRMRFAPLAIRDVYEVLVGVPPTGPGSRLMSRGGDGR